MACIIEGAEKLRWSVPEWIARNALFFLLAELSRIPQGETLAKRLTTALEQRASFINLSDLFQRQEMKELWQDAVARADQAIAQEDAQDWNVPSAYDAFRTAFNKLRMIAPITSTAVQR